MRVLGALPSKSHAAPMLQHQLHLLRHKKHQLLPQLVIAAYVKWLHL